MNYIVSILIFLISGATVAIPHSGGIAFFLLISIAITEITRKKWNRPKSGFYSLGAIPLLALALPFLAVAIGQILRHSLKFPEFDSPARLLVAIAIVFFLVPRIQGFKLKPSEIMGVGAVFGIFLLYFTVNSDPRVGGRLVSLQSWPNDLGAYAGVLLLFSVWFLLTFRSVTLPSLVAIWSFTSIAIGTGLHVLIETQSRGPWLATTVAFIAIALIVLSRRIGGVKATAVIFLIMAGMAYIISFEPSQRLASIVSEPIKWIDTKREDTSAGERLGMGRAALKLISMQPWVGYGDFGYMEQACTPPFKDHNYFSNSLCVGAGPHNELLARALQSGVWGLLATLFLLCAPIIYFSRMMFKYKNCDLIFNPSLLGFIFSTHIFVISFFMEPYSIKFTATFNASVLSILFAEVIGTRVAQTRGL